MKPALITSDEMSRWSESLLKEVPGYDVRTGVDARAYQRIGYLESALRNVLNHKAERDFYRKMIKGMK